MKFMINFKTELNVSNRLSTLLLIPDKSWVRENWMIYLSMQMGIKMYDSRFLIYLINIHNVSN